MKNYRFDIDKMIKWLMPYFLLKPRHYAWLQTLLSPVKNLYASFLAYRQLQLRNATVNSQKNRLERALRDEFADETIYILHLSDYLDQAFIYLEIEGATPQFDYLASENHVPVDYDYTQVEYNSQYDFIVRIPAALAGKTPNIYAYLKNHIYTGISYTIETF